MERSLFGYISLLRGAKVLPHGAALLLGYDNEDYDVIKDVVKTELGLRLLFTTSRNSISAEISRIVGELDFAICDLTRIKDADDIVDLGLELRGSWPDLPLIFILDNVQRDDLSRERSPICDATLKHPVKESTLLLGIGAALSNRNHMLAKPSEYKADSQVKTFGVSVGEQN